MRHRLMAACAAALLATLVLAATAQAAAWQRHRSPRGAAVVAHVQQKRALAEKYAGVRFVPPLERLALGAAALNGTVTDYYGIGLAGVWTEAWVPVGDEWGYQSAQTDGAGHFTMADLPGATANGELWVYPDLPYMYAKLGLSWADPGTTTVPTLQPGGTSVSLTRGGPWHFTDHPDWNWSMAFVDLYGASQYSSSVIEATSGSASPVGGTAYALPDTQTLATVNFWNDEGVEVPVSITTTAGALNGLVTADQTNAMRCMVVKPYWASGKPGTTARVAMGNFPVGWVTELFGWSDSPTFAGYKEFGTFTTPSLDDQSKAITIPRTAKPGYSYSIYLQHQGGGLTLQTPFQVCTFKASKTSVARGGSVRLSGVVPTQGHWGSTAGNRKYVNIYAAKPGKAVPTWWNPVGHGWTKIATVRTNGYGAFSVSKSFTASRTLVARYAGDNWYWGAYTSTLGIRVTQ